MIWLAIARALHIVAVVHWIGGLAFVTLVVLPLARSAPDPERRLALFEGIENRFAAQARVSVPLAGLTGFYLLSGFGGMERLMLSWPILAMVAVWSVFMVMLFAAEPLFLHAWFRRAAIRAPDRTFAWAQGLHAALLVASVAAAAAGALAAHGALA